MFKERIQMYFIKLKNSSIKNYTYFKIQKFYYHIYYEVLYFEVCVKTLLSRLYSTNKMMLFITSKTLQSWFSKFVPVIPGESLISFQRILKVK